MIPSHAPEAWIDELADQVEIQRLCSMKVLVRADEYQGDASGKLTTRLVRDWRLKPYGGAGNIEVDASFQICCKRVCE